MKDQITTTIINVFMGPQGESTSTHSGAEEKGTTNIKLWEQIIGREVWKYRCVVNLGFQKTSLYLKGFGTNEGTSNNYNNNRVPVPAGRGGVERERFQQSASTLRGERKRDPQHKVAGKLVGSQD